jgi:hypothetical protein
MRKALVIIPSFILFFVLLTEYSFSKDEKNGFSSLKYNYVVETDMTLSDFSDAFFDRLKSKHNWMEVSKSICKDEICTSTWSFTDEELHIWKCDVTIKKAEVINQVLVIMEMNPVLGS